MRSAIPALCALLLAGCNGGDTASNVAAPGSPKSAKTGTLEAGAALLQTQPPIGAINAYLDGFHFYNGRVQQQMEAHHYCAILNEDVIQCVIYDGNVKDAKLMGVEYIVSAKLFGSLPPAEKALWHSHVHEVKSGQLIAPGIPDVAEHELMEKLIHTYGKTWHTWHTDMNKELPLGVPQLMMGFTADGQHDAQWSAPAMSASMSTARRNDRSARISQLRRSIRAPMPGSVATLCRLTIRLGRIGTTRPTLGLTGTRPRTVSPHAARVASIRRMTRALDSTSTSASRPSTPHTERPFDTDYRRCNRADSISYIH